MKKAYQFPAISHFCDVMRQEQYDADTQLVLNSISIHSATQMEFLLMKLHKEQNHNFLGVATGEGWDCDEMLKLHPDMLKTVEFCDAIMLEDYSQFA